MQKGSSSKSKGRSKHKVEGSPAGELLSNYPQIPWPVALPRLFNPEWVNLAEISVYHRLRIIVDTLESPTSVQELPVMRPAILTRPCGATHSSNWPEAGRGAMAAKVRVSRRPQKKLRGSTGPTAYHRPRCGVNLRRNLVKSDQTLIQSLGAVSERWTN